jgi:VCBS repeat-containing protein
MKRVIIATTAIVTVLAVVAAAGTYDKTTLVGIWEFDVVKMYHQAMEASGQEIPPGMDIERMLEGSYMRITFDEDGTYAFGARAMGNEQTEVGTWEVVESGDDWLKVKSIDEAKGKEQVIRITFTDEDHFDALMTNGEQEMTLSAARVTAETSREPRKDAGTSD